MVFNLRWGSIISIFVFEWGFIHIFMGWGCNQEWGFNGADTVHNFRTKDVDSVDSDISYRKEPNMIY